LGTKVCPQGVIFNFDIFKGRFIHRNLFPVKKASTRFSKQVEAFNRLNN